MGLGSFQRIFLPPIGGIEYRNPSATKRRRGRSGSLGLLSLVSPAEKVQVLVVAQAPQRLPPISPLAHTWGHRRAHTWGHRRAQPWGGRRAPTWVHRRAHTWGHRRAHTWGHRRAHILGHTYCTPAVWLPLAPVLPQLHVERAHKPSVVWRIPLRLHAERVQQPSPLAPVLP